MALPLETARKYFAEAFAKERLPHAVLITGPTGSGKQTLAAEAARIITSQTKDAPEPLQHPEVHVVEPESKSRRVRIEQVRELEHRLRMRSWSGGHRLGVIFDADRLQPQAANAFLKTLEEPPEKTQLLLVTAHPDALLDTIRSRCIRLALFRESPPPPDEREQAVDAMLDRWKKRRVEGLPATLALIHDFQSLLKETKAGLESSAQAEQAGEKAELSQRIDDRWFKEREKYFVASVEADYRRERSQLLDRLIAWWANELRGRPGSPSEDQPGLAIIERIDRLHRLREHLETNVQEALAVEAAFLTAFR